MNIKKSNGTYQVESESREGVFYTVDANKKTCSCPGFLFYARRKGDVCKHVKAVLEYIDKNTECINKNVDKISKYKNNSESCNHTRNKTNNSKKKISSDGKKAVTKDDVLRYIMENDAQKKGVDSVELLDKFSEELINKMIHEGILLEEKGKIKLIE